MNRPLLSLLPLSVMLACGGEAEPAAERPPAADLVPEATSPATLDPGGAATPATVPGVPGVTPHDTLGLPAETDTLQ